MFPNVECCVSRVIAAVRFALHIPKTLTLKIIAISISSISIKFLLSLFYKCIIYTYHMRVLTVLCSSVWLKYLSFENDA